MCTDGHLKEEWERSYRSPRSGHQAANRPERVCGADRFNWTNARAFFKVLPYYNALTVGVGYGEFQGRP